MQNETKILSTELNKVRQELAHYQTPKGHELNEELEKVKEELAQAKNKAQEAEGLRKVLEVAKAALDQASGQK